MEQLCWGIACFRMIAKSICNKEQRSTVRVFLLRMYPMTKLRDVLLRQPMYMFTPTQLDEFCSHANDGTGPPNTIMSTSPRYDDGLRCCDIASAFEKHLDPL